MADVVDKPWDGSQTRFTDPQYEASCVLDRGGDAPAKDRCSLPIREPSGEINKQAVHAAAARIGQVDAPADAVHKAAKALVGAHATIGVDPPDSLKEKASESRAVLAASGPPRAGHLEARSAPGELHVEGRTLHGTIPFGIESRDLGGWKERMAAGSLRSADLSDLVVTVDHGGVPLGRYPNTLAIEDRADGLHWSCELPESRADVREAVKRGDLKASSWRMVVARDSWDGDLRTVEEVRSLRDVSVVTTPAYPAATAELRAAPEPQLQPQPEEAPVSEEKKGGGLTVEARSATDERDIESRVLEAIRSVPPGESRSLTTTSASPIDTPELATYIFDKLRPSSVMLAAGIRVMTTTRESIVWPRTITDVNPSWTAEGAQIIEGDPAWDQLTITPSKLAHRILATNEALDDAPVDLLGWLQAHLLRLIALKLDVGLLEGNPTGGAPGVQGLKYQAGIQTITQTLDTGNGAAITDLDAIAKGIAAIEEVNATPSAIIMTPQAWFACETVKDHNARYLLSPGQDPTQAPARSLFGVPVYVTSQLSTTEGRGTSTNTSSIYVFDSSQVVLVRRADVQVEVDRYQYFDSDQTQIRAKLRVGFVLPHPQAVARVVGILPAS